MKRCAKAVSFRAIVALTLSVMLTFSSASGLFALETELQTIPDCETAEILNKALANVSEAAISNPSSSEELLSEVPQNSTGELEVSESAETVDAECEFSDFIKEELSVPALENSKEIFNLEDLYDYDTVESRGLNTNYFRLEFFIGSIAAFSNGDLALSASIDITTPVYWLSDEYGFQPTQEAIAEILNELALPVGNIPPTGDYLPPILMTVFRNDGVGVLQFVIQPIDNLSLNISTNFPHDKIPSFWLDGLYIGQIVTLETILEAIYERTGFNGEGFGPPGIWGGRNSDGSPLLLNYVTVSYWTGLNFATIFFPPLDDDNLDNDLTDPPEQEVKEAPDLCSQNEASETTSTPALGPKTGDDTNQSKYLTVMIVALVIIGASAYKLVCTTRLCKTQNNSSPIS